MIRTAFAALAAAVGLGCIVSVLAQSPDVLKGIRINNFGEVNPSLYRGAQPEGRDYPDLAALGIKTVIDLEQSGRSDEEQKVTAAGMRFFRIPMSDRKTPEPEQVSQFLKLVEDPAEQPVFVHCHGGRHRTGAMIAVYRMSHDGWDETRAYQEMRQYRFTTIFGHAPLRQFVRDYYAELERTKTPPPAAIPAAATVAQPGVSAPRQ